MMDTIKLIEQVTNLIVLIQMTRMNKLLRRNDTLIPVCTCVHTHLTAPLIAAVKCLHDSALYKGRSSPIKKEKPEGHPLAEGS